MKRIWIILLSLCITQSLAVSADTEPLNELPSPRGWAVLISGLNREPEEKQLKDQAILALRLVMKTQFEIPLERQFIFTSKDSLAYKEGAREANAENVAQTLKTLSQSIRPEDTFIFYYVGQANIVKQTLRLNLPGPDMTHDALSKLLKAIEPRRSLIVLDCPGAGLAIESLTGENRIVIAGAQANQPWSTQFSRYFIPAMSALQADYNRDNRISILEAFRHASIQLDDSYRQNEWIKTENPLLEDDGDAAASQQPWTLEPDKDGEFSSKWFIYELKEELTASLTFSE